jgi:hypothetical protein
VEGQRRREIIDFILAFETATAVVCFASLILGLALRYTPAVAVAVLGKVHTGWLPARERFESSGWRVMAGGRTLGMARVTYRTEEAARLVGLSQLDAEKAVATIQLIAVMRDPSADKGGITAEAARELYEIENEILRDEVLGPRIQASIQRRADTGGLRSLYAAPLQDALKAALDLTDTQESSVDVQARPLWFYIAAVASADSGLVDSDDLRTWLGDQMKSSVATEAYLAAKGRLRAQVFGRP